ncbi:hypothetical protein TrST_g8534 [Triparma strigata]|uniref:Acyl-CoA dehydrogenase/oxidase C-terminal domain-containing protein n=1 Tax=Triparma strigata TaxID=1606541 RepID=A0A9W7BIY5_9STRA|nr:hypothetical protein TrST_g8534 [Triparma strigata]
MVYVCAYERWFFTLAKLDEEITLFFIPRILDDGEKNIGLRFRRLKNKLGDHSNASSEVDYHSAISYIIGSPGSGIKNILKMVHTTRLDCAIGSAAGIDRAYRIARNHVENRKAFGKYLKDLPAMENLMDDLRVENIASSLLVFKMSSVFEEDLGRVGVPVAKFHVCKKQPNFVYECMEVLGGNGYVEDWPIAKLFRASPLNSIWEGSGNVMALDVIRSLQDDKVTEALKKEWTKGLDSKLDDQWSKVLGAAYEAKKDREYSQWNARKITEGLAVAMQGGELIKAAEKGFIEEKDAKTFLATRMGGGKIYGVL